MRILLAVASDVRASSRAFALDAANVEKLAFGESDEQVAAIAALVASGRPARPRSCRRSADGELQTAGKRVLIVKGEEATDAVTGAKVAPLPEEREDVVANNRLRRELAGALAGLKLISPQREARLAAAKELASGADAAMLPLVKKALEKEERPRSRRCSS